MASTTRRSAHPAQAAPAPAPRRRDPGGGLRGGLSGLFPAVPAVRAVPAAPAPVPWAALPAWARRVLVTVASVAAVVLGAAVLLVRVPGLPAWDTVYSEDYSEFLLGAFRHPWDLLAQYNGYAQLLPRLVAQLVSYLPLAEAAKALALAGALTAAACALFTFHASAGHIRSVMLRVLLAAAVILLPVAPLEIADSTVDAPWYLLLAAFWAVLWRPRTRTGMTAAALVGFAAASSSSIVILLAPLLALRGYALRRPRDHAVTAGWLAGCLIQLPIIIVDALSGQSRLVGGQNPGPGPVDRMDSLTFYLHDVVLRAVGWHLSWRLESLTTTDWATLAAAVALAAVLGAITVTHAGTRPFTAAALATGFVFTVVSASLTPWEASAPVSVGNEATARYTALPIFLIEAALIAGADHVLRGRRELRAPPPGTGRRRPPDTGRPQPPGTGRPRPATALRPAVAVAALAAFLAAGWVSDFRYQGMRSVPSAHAWNPIVAQWRHDCEVSRTGTISVLGTGKGRGSYWTIPCDRIRFLRPGATGTTGRAGPRKSHG